MVINAAGGEHARKVAARVREHGGRVIVVVGHSNTIPAIVEALGAPAVGAIADAEYFHMFIVQVNPAGVTVIRSRY
jgi:broad specificity phosphatase PhoE